MIKKNMETISKYVKKVNALNYNAQCKHVRSKLLSTKHKDIAHTLFFKKLYMLFDDLPRWLRETSLDTGVRKVLFINLWDRFDEQDKYFYEDIGLIKIECLKLPNSTYVIAISIKNTDQQVYILFFGEINDHCKQM